MASLRQAVAPVKEQVLDLVQLEPLLPEEVGRRTEELLEEQGWCLWQCPILGGDIIKVVRDETVRSAGPAGYPVYLFQELEELWDRSEETIRLVHEAKKLAGGEVVSRGRC